MTTAPNFTLRQLTYLVAAADHGTLSAAGQHLHVSSSALSDALTELERTLGAKLTIRRRAHGITLTTAGVRIVEQARPLLTAARELAASLQAVEGELVGPITIGCYPTLVPPCFHPCCTTSVRRIRGSICTSGR